MTEAERTQGGVSATWEEAGGRAVLAALRQIRPGFDPADAGKAWHELGLDSFDLLSLRLAVEERAAEIPDTDWVDAATPDALIRLAAAAGSRSAPPVSAGVSLDETIELGMPQMALSGLSESWLLKALGDCHWRMVAAALETRTADIRDSFGNRLYPAFTRVRFVSSAPLFAFEEGEKLRIEASLTRYGAAIYFSRLAITGEKGRAIEGELMSSFTYRPDGGSNAQLLRSQPMLPEPCAAPAHAAMPAFGLEYARRRRARNVAAPVVAAAPYALIPQYDINGVGLLYYASYPIIADICQMRASAGGAAWATGTSTVERDVSYFANADPGAALEWRLHRDEDGDGLRTEASIVRGDGVVMALVTSRKEAL